MSPQRSLYRRTANRHAFTLVELLVVIGIIAIMISLLLPALNKARRAAQTVACASNMRQVGQAMVLYVGEYKTLPYGAIRFTNISSDRQTTWDDLISRQLGQNYPDWQNSPWGMGTEGYRLPSPMKVLICPSDDIPQNWTDPYMYKRSYSVPVADTNGDGESDTLFTTTNVWPTPAGVVFRAYKLTDARNASGTLLLVERHSNFNIQGTTNNVRCQYTEQQYTDDSRIPLAPNGAHSGKWNYLFADGHVEALVDRETWGATGAKIWWSRGPWTRTTSD